MIQLKNVHKSYMVKDKQIPALSGIDLSIVRGEIFGVIGHSGAGKSTLVRLINLLERPSGGRDHRRRRGHTGFRQSGAAEFQTKHRHDLSAFQSAEFQDGG